MFDFDVVTGPGNRAKPAQSDARRQPVPPAAAPARGINLENHPVAESERRGVGNPKS